MGVDEATKREATPRPWHRSGAIIYADNITPRHKLFTEQPAIAACSPQAAKDAGFIDGAHYDVPDARAIHKANAELIVRAVNRDHLFDALVAECERQRKMLHQLAPLAFHAEVSRHLPGNVGDELKEWVKGRSILDELAVLSLAEEGKQ